MTDTAPIGASVTLEVLQDEPYDLLARLRVEEPVSWVPALNGWLVTSREIALDAMRDADTFTVDDPRFTTAAVLGPSMLSLDGPEHDRHRSPFAPSFRPRVVREQFADFLADEAKQLVAAFADGGAAELRTRLAGPLAVNTITRFLGLNGVTATEVLAWYQHISEAIVDLTTGRSISAAGRGAVSEIHERVAATLASNSDSLLLEVQRQGILRTDEIGSAAAVLMFGAIETAEGMTANALWHLLTHPKAVAAVRADRSLIHQAIEESLRLEPAAGVIDRYATREVELGPASIAAGDLVSISLLAANRDPGTFDDPDRYDLHRANARQHLTFVQGPHGCLGLHLARLETYAAINAVLDAFPAIDIDHCGSTRPAGLIFRKPDAVVARWNDHQYNSCGSIESHPDGSSAQG